MATIKQRIGPHPRDGRQRSSSVSRWSLAIAGFFSSSGRWSSPTPVRSATARGRSQAGEARPDPLPARAEPYFAEMDKGLLMQPAPGPPIPTRSCRWRRSPGSSRKRCRQARSAGRTRGSSGPAATTASGISRRAIPRSDRSTSSRSFPPIQARPTGAGTASAISASSTSPASRQAAGPDDKHFGLWIDQRDPDCAPDPFGGNAAADGNPRGIRRVKIGRPRAVGTAVPVGSYYGEPTGVIGPAPVPQSRFRREGGGALGPGALLHRRDHTTTTRTWCAPIASACPAPSAMSARTRSPPRRIRKTRAGRELTSNPGAQYFWVDRIFFWNTQPREQAGRAGAERGQLPLSSCSTPIRRARSTPRSSRPTT